MLEERTVLQGTKKVFRAAPLFLFVLMLVAAATCASDPPVVPIVPLSVCEVLRDLPSHEGKEIAVIGRYSFREKGISLGEQACEPPVSVPPQFSLVESTSGPKPPNNFELDAIAVKKKFTDLRRRTALGKFRFGTPDYDRWAVVYGEVKAHRGTDGNGTAADLIYRGSGVVIFLNPEQ
jgi:hypothetical protein